MLTPGGEMEKIGRVMESMALEEIDTSKFLRHAHEQAKKRNYQDFIIVDCDAHHYEYAYLKEIVEYVEDPVIKDLFRWSSSQTPGRANMMTTRIAYTDVGGRILGSQIYNSEKRPEKEPEVKQPLAWMDAMGVDYAAIFPTIMLELGLHPQVEVEVNFSRAYNRWVTERILSKESRLISQLYLPFNDPEAAYKTVKDFGDKPGVVGFLVASSRYKPVYHNDYMKTYALLEEMGKPLCFHSSYNWNDQLIHSANRFITAHALGFTFFNVFHCANWIVNGLPELFPKLKVIWTESGLAWAPWLAQRLDHEYKMRVSDCPLLKKLPSEYMKEMYYSTQPMEMPDDMDILKTTFKVINAETQLLYASDYPHWDMDLPSTIYDLPFLSEQAKRNILGGNAARVYNLNIGDRLEKKKEEFKNYKYVG